MAEAPATRNSLLVRLRDPRDAEAWREFVHLYAPLVYAHVRAKGLQDADAADLAQDVLRGVSGKIIGLGYDPERGSFRNWFFTLVRRRLIDFWRGRHHRVQASGDSATVQLLQEQPAPEEKDRWNEDFQRRLFHCAAERVQPMVQATSWQAFWQSAVEGRAGADVARELGMTVASVYLAKSRIMARLKAEIQKMSDEREMSDVRD